MRSHTTCFNVLLLCLCAWITQTAGEASLKGVPNWTGGAPSVSRVTASSFHVNVQLDRHGVYYWVLVPGTDSAPSSIQVKLWQSADNYTIPIAVGGQKVGSIGKWYTDVVFRGLKYVTHYSLYIVAEDESVPPKLQPEPTRRDFQTLDGRKSFLMEPSSQKTQTRLGIQSPVRERHVPTPVPHFSNLTVVEDMPFTVFTTPDGRRFSLGDHWSARMLWSTENYQGAASVPQKPVTSYGGSHHLTALRHQCLVAGANLYGQLGLGDRAIRLTAEPVPGYRNVAAVSAGLEFSMILENGTVYTFGRNHVGQLGLGHRIDQWMPTPVPNHTQVSRIAAGRDHAMILDNGQVFAMGSNRFGQLGLGDTVDRIAPTPLDGFSNVSAIMAGNYFSAFIQGGQLYAFGYNYQVGGVFAGYSPQNMECHLIKSPACATDPGRLIQNLDRPDEPYFAELPYV